MLEILTLTVSILCVGILVYIHTTAKHLPPKAKLVCDVWALVEKDSNSSAENRVVNWCCTTSSI